jgi:hypothetical protein
MLILARLSLLLCAGLLATGCVSPYLRVHESAKGLKGAPTLLVSAKYGDDTTGNAKEKPNLLKVAVKVASNINLDEVGAHLIRVSTDTAERFGFKVAPDKERAQSIDLIKGGAMDALADVAQVVSGVWIYPEGARNVFIDDRTWLLDSYKESLVKSLKSATEGEHFMFISARHRADSEWLFFERAEVVLYFMIMDEQGTIVFEGRGVGYGSTGFWSEDSSPSGLNQAIDAALADMLAQPQEALK